jgi:transposase
MLRNGQPWQPQEIQHLLNEEFDIEYHPAYLSEFLKDLSLSYAISRTKRPSRPDNAEEILDERVADALAEDTEQPHNKCEDDGE